MGAFPSFPAAPCLAGSGLWLPRAQRNWMLASSSACTTAASFTLSPCREAGLGDRHGWATGVHRENRGTERCRHSERLQYVQGPETPTTDGRRKRSSNGLSSSELAPTRVSCILRARPGPHFPTRGSSGRWGGDHAPLSGEFHGPQMLPATNTPPKKNNTDGGLP